MLHWRRDTGSKGEVRDSGKAQLTFLATSASRYACDLKPDSSNVDKNKPTKINQYFPQRLRWKL